MTYDPDLAQRVRALLATRDGITERVMFGGLSFLLYGHMAVGIHKDELIVHLAAEDSDTALQQPGVRVFDLTGRPMRGWVLISAEQLRDDGVLGHWVAYAINYASSLPVR